MSKSLFVTATGTDIGKTYVSGLIVKKMREFGFNCGYFKPVLSGAERLNGEIILGDCMHVIDVAGLSDSPFDCVSYYFEEPLSPHLASERAGTVINPEKIFVDYKRISEKYDYILIEGAGGITCPIICNDKIYLMSDLIKDMNKSVLIIADAGLGTINSVLTTVEYINNRNIKISGIVLNNYEENDYMHKDNLEIIEKLTSIKVVAIVSKDAKSININKAEIISLFSD